MRLESKYIEEEKKKLCKIFHPQKHDLSDHDAI